MTLSEQFITEERSLEEFKRILTGLPGYERLEDSQIVEAMSLFQSWALRQANWQAERIYQEAFLTTAINRSSVLAHAESRQYVPRKPTPSRGTVRLINKGDQPVSFPVGTQWVGSNQLPYQNLDDVVVPAGGSVDAEFAQLEEEVITHHIESSRPFYEIALDRERSLDVSDFSVSVDGDEWVMRPRLMNTPSSGRAYDEFYTALGEIGIRFGNGAFGRIPRDGAEVLVTLKMTRGKTELLRGQEIRYISGSGDRNVAMVEAETVTAIAGGRQREGIEEVRRNALYYPLYDEQLTWRDDYEFAIRRRWPEVVWANAWGEHEQEKVHGMSLDNIGRIFITAHAPDNPDVLSEVAGDSGLDEPISRVFEMVPPNFKPFTITLTAILERHIPVSQATNDVRSTLERYYGRDSEERRPIVKLKDLYRAVSSTGNFEMGDFTVEVHGDTESNGLNDMVHIDWSASTIDVGYAA